MKKLLFTILALNLLTSLIFAQSAPIKPTNLPVGTNYTMEQILNNVFVSPNALRTSASSTTLNVIISSVVVQSNDQRYYNKNSTGTAGSFFTSTTITPAYNVDTIGVYSLGGDSTFTCTLMNGTVTALEGIPNTVKFDIPMNTPSFIFTLPANTTVYYVVTGVK